MPNPDALVRILNSIVRHVNSYLTRCQYSSELCYIQNETKTVVASQETDLTASFDSHARSNGSAPGATRNAAGEDAPLHFVSPIRPDE
jgi:hypothetical protein